MGKNTDGQVGNGTTLGTNSPVSILSNVKEVSLGSYHSVAITTNGNVYVWGSNERGALGDGSYASTATKVTKPSILLNNG